MVISYLYFFSTYCKHNGAFCPRHFESSCRLVGVKPLNNAQKRLSTCMFAIQGSFGVSAIALSCSLGGILKI